MHAYECVMAEISFGDAANYYSQHFFRELNTFLRRTKQKTSEVLFVPNGRSRLGHFLAEYQKLGHPNINIFQFYHFAAVLSL